eukprot:GHVU01172705.1.p2 GENE.GHVU01172705.1~~GHVU01172705.1.p2  ORF type:complete len:155 (+),score=15.81 GHVU01172705.1:758-1222(+)
MNAKVRAISTGPAPSPTTFGLPRATSPLRRFARPKRFRRKLPHGDFPPLDSTSEEWADSNSGKKMQSVANLDTLSSKDKEKVVTRLNELQIQDTMESYNGLVTRCFDECITHFRAKTLDSGEEACVERCVKKFMTFSQRAGMRFGELSASKGNS